METLFIDFETRSTVDLKVAGLDNYSKHPDTDIWCLCWVLEGGTHPISGHNGRNLPAQVAMAIECGATVVAHNAHFEWSIWNNICVPRYGWPELDIKQVRCTMAMAYAMSLPGSLDKCAQAIGLDVTKDMAGHRLMMKMCKPRKTKDGSLQWWDSSENIDRLTQYCATDVEVERQLYAKLMQLSDSEQRLWQLDHKINQRGIYVDLHSIDAAIQVVEHEQLRLDSEMSHVTAGVVTACSQAKKLTDWLRYKGISVEGVAKADISAALDETLPADVRKALTLRAEAAKSSTAKLVAMKESASSDSRVRGTAQYHGASTGRWAGRRIQPQNMPRGKLEAKEVNAAIKLFIDGNRDLVDLLYGQPMDVISSCLRGMITASPGNDLIACDFNAIEARVLAWLAGEESVLDIFRGEGKIYEHAAAGIYNKPMADVDKIERQIGKVAVLALGYQGGVGAFQQMARGYGVQVSDTKADEIKTAWREANPAIVRYWWALEGAAVDAVLDAGGVYTAGAKGREVKFRKVGDWLFCQLPSKRVLTYPFPRIVTNKFDRDAIQYMGVDSFSKKWTLIDTYGGKLSENITQAVARDLLADALIRLDDHGYDIVAHVHDEVIIEIPATSPPDTLEKVEHLMAQAPAWADGLPLSAEGWRDFRYKK